MRRRFAIVFACCIIAYITETKAQTIAEQDSVFILANQRGLFFSPQHNALIMHLDLIAGASELKKNDRAILSFSSSVKGLYAITGSLYLSLGTGTMVLRSFDPVANKTLYAVVGYLPVGVGLMVGDDRARVINGLNVFPCYYFSAPGHHKKFGWGFSPELGFYIRTGKRWHVGLMAKLQLIQPAEKKEQNFPRYGFAGVGIILRYD